MDCFVNIPAQTGGGSRALGRELDLVLTWADAGRLSFGPGGAAYLPGSPLRGTFGGASAGLWGYIAATVTF